MNEWQDPLSAASLMRVKPLHGWPSSEGKANIAKKFFIYTSMMNVGCHKGIS
jgi:hypothetical protein